MQRVTIVALWVFCLSFGVSMSLFWWVAAFNDWRITIDFARFGEHWIEGVLFHLAILTSAWGAVVLIKRKV